MRRLSLVLLALCLLGIPALANAGTIRLYDVTSSVPSGVVGFNNAYFQANGGNGGPFWAVTSGDARLNPASFITFCLEKGETFSYNTAYNFALADAAMNGGVTPAGTGDKLGEATKWLYATLRNDMGLAWWNPTGQNWGALTSAGATIQNAIWYLEGEVTSSTAGTQAVALATYAGLQNWKSLEAQGYQVWAMNLTRDGLAQDQLAMTYAPVPEPTSMLLLGSGLLGLAGAARRRLKK